MSRRSGVNPGFTIVELLVVIAIIVILIGLLVGGLAKAREHGRSARCLSNQHAMLIGHALYGLDHEERKPPLAPATPAYTLMIGNRIKYGGEPVGQGALVGKYVQTLDTLWCPSYPVPGDTQAELQKWLTAPEAACDYVYHWFQTDGLPVTFTAEADMNAYLNDVGTYTYARRVGWNALVMDVNTMDTYGGTTPLLSHAAIGVINIGFIGGHARTFRSDQGLTMTKSITDPGFTLELINVWNTAHRLAP